MTDELKFRVLTNEDWKKGTRDELRIREDGRLELGDGGGIGSYTSEPLDSEMEGCRWHYAVFDVDIPANSRFTVSFCSSEKEEAAKSWSGPIPLRDTKYALVQALPGRYIRLKMHFHREGEESPVLKQVKLYYPRLSYLRYLPAVYQKESASKEFLERYLSIFEHALYDSEETISRIPMYFDPEAAPDEFVPWLASWLSLDRYELLGDKNRKFILRAVEFYKQKGTVSGIASLVSFLTGQPCCVKEYMNNVFRSYGMEHEEEDEIVDMREYMRECTKYIEYTKFYECTKFHHRTSKTVDTGYLFSWDSVPGDDDERLLRYLKDDHDIGWAENAKITKFDDKTIQIVEDEISAEITLVEDEGKATLKISNGRTHNLKVKKEDGELNIYDTGILDLIANMGKYCDEVHYVTDTSGRGRYTPHVIGLFIFVSLKEKEFRINKDELHKIINSFLPVFVRAEIIIVEEPYEERYDISGIIEGYKDSIHSCLEVEIKGVGGVYKDSVSWKWLYTNTDVANGRTNDLDYRTPHSKIGVEITL